MWLQNVFFFNLQPFFCLYNTNKELSQLKQIELINYEQIGLSAMDIAFFYLQS